jgi:hypothetical protein
MSLFSKFASVYLSMKECILPSRNIEAQEEILADLHACMEQLMDRACDMEKRIESASSQMVIHAKASKSLTATPVEKAREKKLAKHFMTEKRRIQQEYDKTMKNVNIIQQQIDAVVSSHLNFIIVDTMKQFNVNTARLALPQTTRQVESLEDELNDRSREIIDLQEAISSMSSMGKTLGDESAEAAKDDDMDLWNEVESYLSESLDSVPPSTTYTMPLKKDYPQQGTNATNQPSHNSTVVEPFPSSSLPPIEEEKNADIHDNSSDSQTLRPLLA